MLNLHMSDKEISPDFIKLVIKSPFGMFCGEDVILAKKLQLTINLVHMIHSTLKYEKKLLFILFQILFYF
jgi:hypothetical protein